MRLYARFSLPVTMLKVKSLVCVPLSSIVRAISDTQRGDSQRLLFAVKLSGKSVMAVNVVIVLPSPSPAQTTHLGVLYLNQCIPDFWYGCKSLRDVIKASPILSMTKTVWPNARSVSCSCRCSGVRVLLVWLYKNTRPMAHNTQTVRYWASDYDDL